ncbi:hypothetical protein CO2235_50055 [Cupriavidus oxalaticus]|uniref:Uncharacterized protein n=1 Tax=Cupriavidus oxalaticus TaxID=96344 RepID=A0A375G902_9BURK|nr:hypothetical protein CO2235_50055 [Cupriavidus oxalaticus]
MGAGVRGGASKAPHQARPSVLTHWPQPLTLLPSPPAPLPRAGRGEQTGGNSNPSSPSKSAGLHLDHRSDSRTLLHATHPDPRTVRRSHFNFPFEFNGLYSQ